MFEISYINEMINDVTTSNSCKLNLPNIPLYADMNLITVNVMFLLFSSGVFIFAQGYLEGYDSGYWDFYLPKVFDWGV